MALKEYERMVYAIIEAIKQGEHVKPIQEAIRRVMNKYKIQGTRFDRRASGIIYGVFRNQGLIDRIIESIAGVRTDEIDSDARAVLRLVTYTVQLDPRAGHSIKHTFIRYAKKYLARKGRDDTLKLIDTITRNKWKPISEEDKIIINYRISPQLYRALKHSFDLLGENLEAFLSSTYKQYTKTFRVNSLKASRNAVLEYLRRAGYEVRPGNYSPSAIIVSGSLDKELVKLIETGILTPQDESSMVAVELLDPKPGTSIADLCAAPGGKTSYLAEYTRLKSRIHSFEIYSDRAKRMRRLLERTGTIKAVTIHVGDARRSPEVLGEKSMDYVLVDPPCSSTGAIARNPDVRWRYREEDIKQIIILQQELLEAGWRLLKPGGRLLYTVCSVLVDEGEYVVKQFLEKHGDAALVKLEKPFKQSPLLPGTMRAYPHLHGTIGFYYALLEKK
ncbi:MAG: Fmu (Sun) domain-containing protein [Crenarchaeota archaeon]|nr:Fmu (Sun) domain-containing protein [Thermoproteota archaeon]